ncbi:hypothetical protein B0H13DRAFT_2348689 [Mycena leptocephala]|nr:hypothetical protein B0H13DRAFT_2348689 [Mycena leptocephala]
MFHVPNAHLAHTSEGRRAEPPRNRPTSAKLHISTRSTEARVLAVGVHPAHEARRPRPCSLVPLTLKRLNTPAPRIHLVHLRLHAPPGAPRSYSDLHMLIPPPPCTETSHPNLRLEPATTSTDVSARTFQTAPTSQRKTAAEPNVHREYLRASSMTSTPHAHAQLPLAESPFAPPIARYLLSFAQACTRRSLSIFSPERTHPPPSQTWGRMPLLRRMDPLPAACQDIDGAHSVSRQQPTGTRPCAGQRAACSRTFAADGAEVVPSQRRMKIRMGHALTRRLTDSSLGIHESRKKRK